MSDTIASEELVDNSSTSSTSGSECCTNKSWTQKSNKKKAGVEFSHAKGENKLTPFHLQWSFGLSKSINLINLSTRQRSFIFYASAHTGVLYDYKNAEMSILQGHQNNISSISADSSGKWVVTADAGKDSVVTIWDAHECIPTRTIFNSSPEDGIQVAGISPNAKYLVIVGNEVSQSVEWWLWTLGKDISDATLVLDSSVGKIIKVVFDPENQENFTLTSESNVVFVSWDGAAKLTVFTPNMAQHPNLGQLTDTVYQLGTNRVLTSTSSGSVVVLGDPLPSEETQGIKKVLKVIRLQKEAINVISSIDNIVVTGDSQGQIRFYDQELKILYWCQKFKLDAIKNISFHLSGFRQTARSESTENNTESMTESGSSNNFNREEDTEQDDEYDTLYPTLAPSDATLERKPFIVQDFIVFTTTGRIGLVNFLRNTCDFILHESDAQITCIETHSEKSHLYLGKANGYIGMYNYLNKELLVKQQMPDCIKKDADGTQMSVGISSLKYSSAGYLLACGMTDGTLWLLDPSLLEPLFAFPFRNTSSAITKICISQDGRYLAHKDEDMCVSLYMSSTDSTSKQLVYRGCYRSHYKPIQDIIFTEKSTVQLFSIGRDRCLVEYNIDNSESNSLDLLSLQRIEQSAIPLSMTWYPQFDAGKNPMLFICNDEYKYRLFTTNPVQCRYTFLGPQMGSPVSLMQVLPWQASEEINTNMVFATKKHIGIQILPADGNPFKSVGMVGHPLQVKQLCLSHNHKLLFSLGEDDCSVFMWDINMRAADVMACIGGEDLEPYYCLIEGGREGWLFETLKDMFLFAQLLAQDDPEPVSYNLGDKMRACQVPDVMRAIGFYPSEFEANNMVTEICNGNTSIEVQHREALVQFDDFVRLYVNHRPAQGIPINKVQEVFNSFATVTKDDQPVVTKEIFLDTLQSGGEPLTANEVKEYLTVLLPVEYFTDDIDSEEEVSKIDIIFDYTPDDMNFDVFLNGILGITNTEPPDHDGVLSDNQQHLCEESNL